MLSYSPVDNVKAQNYPSLLVTAGLFDPRVAYWEPLKWVQKLRVAKTDSNPLLLKTDMAAGHFSASDRYNTTNNSTQIAYTHTPYLYTIRTQNTTQVQIYSRDSF